MNRIFTVKQYTAQLGYELRNADQALAVDAMDDAEEGLEELVSEMLDSGRARDRDKALQMAIREYGSPSSVAREYLRRADMEERRPSERADSALGGIFGVFLHKETYLGFLYLLLMFPIGTLLFVYIVTALSLGILFAIIVVGIPILILFLVSIYGIGYLFGRMTESMLGVRMPKKRRRMWLVGSHWNKLRTILKEPRVYSSVLYMLMLFPLGILYFTVLATLVSTSIFLMLAPLGLIWENIFIIGILKEGILIEVLVRTLLFAIGFVGLIWTVHLSNIMWYLHGRLSRLMLLKR